MCKLATFPAETMNSNLLISPRQSAIDGSTVMQLQLLVTWKVLNTDHWKLLHKS